MFNVFRGSIDDQLSDADEEQSLFMSVHHILDEIPVHGDGVHPGRLSRLGLRAFGLVLVGFLAYLPCLWARLPDDETRRLKYVALPAMHFGSFANLLAWFEPGAGGIPLLLKCFIHLESRVGNSPIIFHLFGLSLHCISVLLLWFVLRRLSVPAAWLVAALFASYPANAAAVTWVNQQPRVWAGFFALGGLLLLLKNRQIPLAVILEDTDEIAESTPIWVLRLQSFAIGCAALIAFVLAILCQPSVGVVPLVGAMVILWRKKLQWTDWVMVGVLASVGVAFVVAGLRTMGSPPIPVKIQQLPRLVRLVWPAGKVLADLLMIHPPLSPWSESSSIMINTAIVLGAIYWVAMVLVAALYKKVGAGIVTATACFAVLLPTIAAPVAVHTPENPLILGDTYLCSIPILILGAIAFWKWVSSLRGERLQLNVQFGSTILLLTGAGFLTSTRALAMGSTESMLKAAVAGAPNSLSAKSRIAAYYLKNADNSPESRRNIAAAEIPGLRVEDCPDAMTAVTQGDLQLASGQPAVAVEWYLRAESLDPLNTEAPVHLGASYIRQGRISDAVKCYESATERQPNNAALRNDYGLLLDAMGKPEEALDQYRNAIRSNGDYIPAHINMANTFIKKGQLLEGASEYQKVVDLDPDNFEAFHNAGVVLAELRDYPRAILMLSSAVQLRPESPESHNDLGVALVGAGKYERAIYEFRQAIILKPAYDAAKHNLEVAQRRQNMAKFDNLTSPATAPTR